MIIALRLHQRERKIVLEEQKIVDFLLLTAFHCPVAFNKDLPIGKVMPRTSFPILHDYPVAFGVPLFLNSRCNVIEFGAFLILQLFV